MYALSTIGKWKFLDDISNGLGIIMLTSRQTDEQTEKIDWKQHAATMTNKVAITIASRLRVDSSKCRASWQYVNEGMNSYQTTFYFRSVWKGYTNVVNRRMLPDVHPSAWMSFLLPWHTLLRHYMPRLLPSYWLRLLSTQWKNEHVHFSS